MVFGPAGNRRFWGWGGPGGPKNNSRKWGVRPPPSGMVFGAAGAAQTPKIDDFRPAQNHVLKNQVDVGGRAIKCFGNAVNQSHESFWARWARSIEKRGASPPPFVKGTGHDWGRLDPPSRRFPVGAARALRPAGSRFRCLPGGSPAKIRPGSPVSGPEALLHNIEYTLSFALSHTPHPRRGHSGGHTLRRTTMGSKPLRRSGRDRFDKIQAPLSTP